jgi:hypothetical protein
MASGERHPAWLPIVPWDCVPDKTRACGSFPSTRPDRVPNPSRCLFGGFNQKVHS